MSAFSDYKVGAISYEEFKSDARRECIDVYDRYGCHDCSAYQDCVKQVIDLGYPQCDQGEQYFEDEYSVYEALHDEAFMISQYGCTDKETILKNNDVMDIYADYEDWNND